MGRSVNPEYKGHVLLLNDCREVFSVALKNMAGLITALTRLR